MRVGSDRLVCARATSMPASTADQGQLNSNFTAGETTSFTLDENGTRHRQWRVG
jgi:hypothetical protein